MFLQLLATGFLPLSLVLISFFLIKTTSSSKTIKKPSTPIAPTTLPKSYPLVGQIFSILANSHRRIQWFSDLLQISPSATITIHRFFGQRSVVTSNPAVVQHMLKSHFHIYQKGDTFRRTIIDFLGNGIFNSDGENWKFQRQVASHEFNTKSLRNFVENVVDTELSDRLVPILSIASAQNQVLDFQDILQRFAFDNICKIAFGFDPIYLSPSLSQSKFVQAFEDAVKISGDRLATPIPLIWKIKKVLNVGAEKRIRMAISEIHEFAREIIREKKHELREKASLDSVDLLSRFLNSGHSDEVFVTDIIVSFILAGRDTTSAALTWFFWLISKNPRVQSEILKEITENSEATVYDEVKHMVYTHAALCESMRLYPPVPVDAKEAVSDDVLPEGTVVEKGMRVSYHVYAMGRSEQLWGPDWAEFKPERWLEKIAETDKEAAKWNFMGRDPYTYTVFQAGPRICLGKDMAFLQMKRVVAGVLTRFKVVPVPANGEEPEFVAYLTAKMKGGFPVRIEKRDERLQTQLVEKVARFHYP
ncbi:putative Cytochrome P450 [Quillaja saponaria]|uniref:Cytochrome P450 n=1 Tax=Quillaja saponaria TaxID=32244 RepID=A0AAD7Q9A5_QUISA|nr:putative Cytochrome P450 [Quillaja saponaria]